MHHYEELVETIETDISFAIFGVLDEKILIPNRNLQEKDLEDTRGHHEAARSRGPLGPTDRLVGPTDRWAPVPPRLPPLEASSTDSLDASRSFLKSV